MNKNNKLLYILVLFIFIFSSVFFYNGLKIKDTETDITQIQTQVKEQQLQTLKENNAELYEQIEDKLEEDKEFNLTYIYWDLNSKKLILSVGMIIAIVIVIEIYKKYIKEEEDEV